MKKFFVSVLSTVLCLMSLSSRAQDIVSITFDVNDASLGTINPSPGTYTFAEGDTFNINATAADGYRIYGWVIVGNRDGEMFYHPLDTAVSTLTATAHEINGCREYSVIAIFETVDIYPDSMNLVIGVNNLEMGVILPSSGLFHFAIDDMIYFEAEAFEGYEFIGWHFTIVHPSLGVIQYEEMLLPYNTFGPLIVDNDLIGYLSRIIAIFAPVEGLEKVNACNINAYGKDGRIYLNGADGREVYLFDIYGRMLNHCLKAGATETFNVPAKGVYLLKVEGLGSKKLFMYR